jgi:hypothetical protein
VAVTPARVAGGERTGDASVQSGIWYRALLSDDWIAAGRLSTLCEQFALAVREAGEPAGACLFAITEDAPEAEAGSSGAGATALFFSPTAISVVPRLLATCGARPSAAPRRSQATLLVGRPLDWDLLPRAIH